MLDCSQLVDRYSFIGKCFKEAIGRPFNRDMGSPIIGEGSVVETFKKIPFPRKNNIFTRGFILRQYDSQLSQ